VPAPPYDTVEMVLRSARVRLNDAIQSINGDILTDLAAFTPQAVNNAWRRLQEYLVDRGYSKFNAEVVFSGVPAWGSTDPGVFVSFNWATYSDGVNPWPNPVLPQSLISPLDLYERAHGSNGIFLPMDQVFNGLPTANPGTGPGARDGLNRLWEWRDDTIYMPGATQSTDIRMRYAAYAPDFVYAGGWNIPVPLMRSLNSFAWYVCSEIARPRGDMDAGQFDQYAQDAAEQIWNRDYREGKRLYTRAELGKMTDAGSRTGGANAPAAGGIPSGGLG
jgi:hypothetical protein